MLAHIMARRTTQLLKCAAAVAVLLLSCGPTISADPVLNGWRITFDDEFDGGAGTPPNPSIWLPDVGGTGWGNNELQYYTPGDNTYLDGDGHLVIEARKGSGGHSCWYGTCRYTSGKLTTHRWSQPATFSQRYGRFEARMKVPLGAGMFPAFWLVGDNISNVGHPQAGEIDVMESLGHDVDQVQQHAHGPGLTFGSDYTLPKGQSVADWHTYSVQWTSNLIEWQVDGNTTRSLTKDQAGDGWVFDHAFFMLLNLAVGGDWPGDPDESTVFPGRMVVDYVRVYEPEHS
jgi:beta-glucanase (GH16 family)